MDERPFKEKSLKPTEENLVTVLGKVFTYFVEFNELTINYKHSWNHSKTSGWMEKVEDKKKALYYLIPLDNAFIISMAIRENEKNAILSNADYKKYHAIADQARKYSEGYNVKFEVVDKETNDFSKSFVDIIMSMR